MRYRIITPLLLLLLLSVNLFAQSHNLEQKHIVYSEALKENRAISISMPKSYHKTKKTYPVLYVLDGEWIYGYAKNSVRFLSGEVVGRIPEMIVVGIPNTDRYKDMGVRFNQKGDYLNFIKFIESELKPLINDKYRTNKFDIIYGWSSGGAIAGYFLGEKPQVFDAYIESGSGIGNNGAKFFTEKLPNNTYNKQYLYASTEGIGPRIPALKRYSDLVEKIKPKNLKWKFEILDGLNHGEVLSEGLNKGLKFIFADFAVPESVIENGADSIINHFREIDKNYSFNVEIPIGLINEAVSILVFKKKQDEALKLIKHGLKIHPNSPDLYGTLGEYYETINNKKLAIENYKKAYMKSSDDSVLFLKYKTLYKKLLENSKQ